MIQLDLGMMRQFSTPLHFSNPKIPKLGMLHSSIGGEQKIPLPLLANVHRKRRLESQKRIKVMQWV